MTVLPVTLGSLTIMVKLYIVKNLVADLILGVNYLYHVGATIDFDNEILRLHQRGSGMRATVPFAKVDQAHRRETRICAIRTVPLDPFEQKLVDVRMPSDRVGGPGIVSQYGATSMGSVTANGAVGSHIYEDGCCGGLCRQTHLPFYLDWHDEDVGQVLISISSAGGKP
jgi:hypothetical protein